MKKLAIVGNGIAANALLTELVTLGPEGLEMEVYGDEPRPAYNRVLLSDVLAGEKNDSSIRLQNEQWYEKHNIICKLGTRVERIDHAHRKLWCQNGQCHSYDALVLATGSNARQLGLPGSNLEGVVAFRSMQDTHYLQSLIGSSAKTVVLGGGLLGLEAAAGLARQGTDVTVVHRHAILMNRQLDTEASRLLQARLESMGVRFRTAIEPTALQGDTRVEAVELANGEFLEADCVVQAAGIVANAELARASGLECDQGVLVDDYLRTNKPSVYALGECCEHQGVTVGLVAPIREQAKTLAKVLLGDISQPYRPTATSALLKVSGVQLFSAGDLRPQSPRAEEIVFKAPASASKGSSSYRKIIIHNRKLAGVVMFGDTSDSPWFLEKIQARTDIEDQRENLIFGRQFCA